MKHIPILALFALVATSAFAAEPLRFFCDQSTPENPDIIKVTRAMYVDGFLYGSVTIQEKLGKVEFPCRDSTYIVSRAALVDIETGAPLEYGSGEGTDKWQNKNSNCSRELYFTFKIFVRPSLLDAARWGKDRGCISVEHR